MAASEVPRAVCVPNCQAVMEKICVLDLTLFRLSYSIDGPEFNVSKLTIYILRRLQTETHTNKVIC